MKHVLMKNKERIGLLLGTKKEDGLDMKKSARKQMKRILCFVLTIMVSMSFVSASAIAVSPTCMSTQCATTQHDLMELYSKEADNLNNDVPDADDIDIPQNRPQPSVEIIYEGHELLDETGGDTLTPVLTRGSKAPTSFWNLSTKGSYLATMPDGIGGVTLYTNYYFDFVPYTHTDGDMEGIADGKIYTKYNIYAWDGATGSCRLRLTLYCKDCDEELVSHTSNAAGARDKAGGPITAIAAFSSGFDHRNHFCYFTLENATTVPQMYGTVRIAHSNSELN